VFATQFYLIRSREGYTSPSDAKLIDSIFCKFLNFNIRARSNNFITSSL